MQYWMNLLLDLVGMVALGGGTGELREELFG